MADTAISALSAAAALTGAEQVPIVQSAATVRTTVAAIAASGPAWSSYTPALTAVTTNPTLGTGSTATGKYCQIGKLVQCQVWIKFGSSGNNAGSGIYSISLPVTAVSPLRTGGSMPIGTGWILQASTLVLVNVEQDTTTKVSMRPDGGGNQSVSHATPTTWLANAEMTLTFTYEAA